MNYFTQYYTGSHKNAVGTQVSFFRRHAPLLFGAGAALAAMAVFVQFRTKQAEEENPPIGNFIEVDGIRLHYVERGSGQPVVLLHGNGTMAEELDISGLLNLASRQYRVIAFDRPGYGYSERPRSTAWNPVVVGHSWGTLVAIALGLEYPEYVRSSCCSPGITIRRCAPTCRCCQHRPFR